MIGFQGESNIGIVILILCLLVVVIGFIWLELIEKPRERKQNQIQFEELKKESGLLDSSSKLSKFLEFIGTKVFPCKKCESREFSVWDIQSNVITVRCNHCKKKYEYKDLDLMDGFIQSFIFYHNRFLELISIKNPLLDEFKKNSFDFSKLRSNQPAFQAYHFLASKVEEVNAKEELETSNQGNRRIPKNVQDSVWRRDQGRCVSCGSQEKLEFDHIIPFSKGGSNTYRNVQLLWESCNRLKSDKIG